MISSVKIAVAVVALLCSSAAAQAQLNAERFGRLGDQIRDLNRAQNFRQHILVDPIRLQNLSQQLDRGVLQLETATDVQTTECDLRPHLGGIAIRPTANFLAGFETTPCATFKKTLDRQRRLFDLFPTAKLRPVTPDEQQLLQAQSALTARFPNGFTLAPFAVTTPKGTQFSITLPGASSPEVDLILAPRDLDGVVDGGGSGFDLSIEGTSSATLPMIIEPILDSGALTFDPDQIHPHFGDGDLNAESCFGNEFGLVFNCFGATVALEAIDDPEAPNTFGSAVLIDAEAGLYLSAFHVARARSGVFFATGATDTPGHVNARFKMATGTLDEPDIMVVDERYGIERTEQPVLNAKFHTGFDLILFRALPKDPDLDPSLLTEARILKAPAGEGLRLRDGTHVVGAGYGGSPDEDGGGEGLRRFSRLQIGTCEDGTLACVEDEWLVVGERVNDLASEDHEACPSDSGSALFVETSGPTTATWPIIAVAGILNGRLSSAVSLAETSEELCSASLKYIDLTHPDVHKWIVTSAAELTGRTEAEVAEAYFLNGDVVSAPGIVLGLGPDLDGN